jgi:hypothetical protein
MKKFEVYFFSENKGEKERAVIYAESQMDAMRKFVDGKALNDFETVVVSAASFIGSITSMPESFPNPLYTVFDKKQTISKTNQDAVNYLVSDDLSRSTDVFGGITNDKLDKLIELQEKQLYWIRIIGIPFLFAAIGGFLAILFR